MKAITLRHHGGPEVLKLEELPDLIPGPGEVRVQVRACALNRLDLWVRRGLPHLRLTYPFILGADVAGVVDGVGAGVRGVKDGDAVVLSPGVACGRCGECLAGRDNLCRDYGILGETRDGGYAEQIVVPAVNVVPAPKGLTWAERAAPLLTYLTVWQMLVKKARVQPGETVLVHAAGSGIGVAAIQVAKLFGAEVIATARSDDKLHRARALGADHALLSDDDLVAQVRRLTGKRGVQVVVEHTGAQTWPQSILACARGGRIVTCGATSGFDARTDLRHVFFRQLTIFGSTMGSKGDLYEFLPHLEERRLRSVIDRIYPLAEARAAHEHLEGRHQFGKIVLALPEPVSAG